MTDVLVLNADELPLHRVSLRHAVRMLVRQVALVHEAQPDKMLGVFPMPTVVRLVNYVVTKWRMRSGPSWTKPNVLKRDGRRCGYCGKTAGTVDHVLPSSRGGRNTWENTVACCNRCNQRKADRLPAEAGMVLRIRPYAPTWAQFAQG